MKHADHDGTNNNENILELPAPIGSEGHNPSKPPAMPRPDQHAGCIYAMTELRGRISF